MLLLCAKETVIRISCAVRARPNPRTRETPSLFAEEGREEKAGGKHWQKNSSVEVSGEYQKQQGTSSQLQLGSNLHHFVEIPSVGSVWSSLENGWKSAYKVVLNQWSSRAAPATCHQQGWAAGTLWPPFAIQEQLLLFSQQSYFRNQLFSAQLTFSLMHFYTISARTRRIFTFFNKPDSLQVIGDV